MASSENTECKKKCSKSSKEGYSAEGKIAIVTGGNSGIGYETVKHINLAGAKVYMLCRSKQRADEAKQQLIEEGCDGDRLIYVHCDFANFATVRECAKNILEMENTIDILVNNAGIMFYPKFEKTVDGHEMTWQCNHLGPFLLTTLLLPAIKNSQAGRIVNVSSLIHEKASPVELSTVDEEKNYGMFAPYSRSKLANVMHAVELSSRLQEEGVTHVTVNSLHPGVVNTNLSRHTWLRYASVRIMAYPIQKLFFKTPYDGAKTSLHCALSKDVEGVTGKYFSDSKVVRENPHALDKKACKELYDYSLKTVGL